MYAPDKIVALEELPALVAKLRSSGKKIVTTNGAFDLLHVGHVRMLEASKGLGDVLIVGVNSDASIKRYKAPERPIIPEAERAEVLAALAAVDYVTIFEEERPLRFLELVRPDVHTKGGEYDMEKLHETELIKSYGGKIVRMENVKSTTGIIERILAVYGKVPADQTEPQKENGGAEPQRSSH